jgi:hypothetical protein
MAAAERGQMALVLPLGSLVCGGVAGPAVPSPGHPRRTLPLVTRASREAGPEPHGAVGGPP